MIRLSAFADEISSDLEEQISVLQSEGIHAVELRSVWGINVLQLSDQQLETIKERLDAKGMSVAAIGSPIGKVPLDFPFDEHLKLFEHSIAVAHRMATPFIRLFSFYPPMAGSPPEPEAFRDEVLRRLLVMTEQAQKEEIILLHENEKEIYGDTIAHCVELLKGINNPHFRAVLDPANYLQCEQIPYPDGYEAVLPWLGYIHVKDVRPDGTLAAAGEGAANWPALLQRLQQDGYDGILALEPHLAAAGQYQGFSGPDLFRRASQALQGLLRSLHWDYR
jgi:3-dehydroshikimate dehydratase